MENRTLLYFFVKFFIFKSVLLNIFSIDTYKSEENSFFFNCNHAVAISFDYQKLSANVNQYSTWKISSRPIRIQGQNNDKI